MFWVQELLSNTCFLCWQRKTASHSQSDFIHLAQGGSWVVRDCVIFVGVYGWVCRVHTHTVMFKKKLALCPLCPLFCFLPFHIYLAFPSACQNWHYNNAVYDKREHTPAHSVILSVFSHEKIYWTICRNVREKVWKFSKFIQNKHLKSHICKGVHVLCYCSWNLCRTSFNLWHGGALVRMVPSQEKGPGFDLSPCASPKTSILG